MLKRIGKYIARYWYLHLVVLVLSLAAAGMGILQPWLFQLIIDHVFVGGERQLFVGLLVGYALAHVLALAIEIVRHYCSVLAGNRAVVDLRNDLVRHLRRLSLRFFYREETGRILSVMTHDAPAMERLFQSLLPTVVLDVSYLIGLGYIIIARSGHAALTITAFLMIPFYIFYPAAISRTFRQAFRRVQESQADILAGLQESVASTREIVAFGREDWDEKRLSTLFTRSLTQRLKAILLEARYGGLQNLASFVSPFFILIVGAPFVLRGDVTVGYILAFQQWTQLLYTHARSLYDTNQSVQQALGAAERVNQFLDEPVDPVRLLGSRRLERVEGALAFEDVHFSYNGSKPVLNSVSLRIEPGMRVALVGPSGSGKSTLLLLLLRFFDPDRGKITLDGVDLRDLDVGWLREQTGVVFQDAFLFTGSLYDNIRFGRDGVARCEVLQAAELAQVTSFADELPDGFDTLIGERGVRLSGGQKQRVAIARALVRNPRILLLDEATSALDAESEHQVQLAMDAVMQGRTTIVIAHRLSTIRNADLIVFLRDGHVVEAGTHGDLMADGGEYARFYELQFGEAEIA